MNKTEIVMRELKNKIIIRDDINAVAKKYRFDPVSLRKLLLNKKYLVTIFRGIYYLKRYEERKFNSMKFSAYELLSLGLKIKGVKWYLGLNTALKFLNLTHEIVPVNYVINNKFNRIRPLKIAGSNFLFIKIKPSLFSNIIEKKTKNNIPIYYSNLEKTLLDFIYLKRNVNLKEYRFSKKTLLKYAGYYDSRTKRVARSEVENE